MCFDTQHTTLETSMNEKAACLLDKPIDVNGIVADGLINKLPLPNSDQFRLFCKNAR